MLGEFIADQKTEKLNFSSALGWLFIFHKNYVFVIGLLKVFLLKYF